MTLRRRVGAGSLRVTSVTAAAVVAMMIVAACSSSSSSSSSSAGSSTSASSTSPASTTGSTIIVDLTYNDTAFWAAYINYETQCAAQLHVKLLGPLLAAANGSIDASQSQPANLYAYWALKYALDAANGVTLSAGQPGGGAPTLQMVSYAGDTNLGDPIVAPFVTKAAQTFTIAPVDGQSGTVTTTPVSDSALWGNVYGNAHGGVCSSSAS